MWIKTCDGEYINTDFVSTMKTFGGNDTQIKTVDCLNWHTVSRDTDVRDEIVRNIISCTPFMEVR